MKDTRRIDRYELVDVHADSNRASPTLCSCADGGSENEEEARAANLPTNQPKSQTHALYFHMINKFEKISLISTCLFFLDARSTLSQPFKKKTAGIKIASVVVVVSIDSIHVCINRQPNSYVLHVRSCSAVC